MKGKQPKNGRRTFVEETPPNDLKSERKSPSSERGNSLMTRVSRLHAQQHFPVPLLPLIGREREVEAIRALLLQEGVRLLTLTGPGGVGKTRLAVEIAIETSTFFADGVYFVSLAPVHSVERVLPTIAQTLGLTEMQGSNPFVQVQSVVREKLVLLLLDNFEQVVAAAPELKRLLALCPHLTILVTSRMVLGLLEEREFRVAPLALPDLTHLPSCEDLSQIPAVALFLQRAGMARPDFVLTASNAQAIAQICVRLDGLPLALELAAARLKLFSPQSLLTRLSHRLALLTSGTRDAPERQQTLRKTVEWSYYLLTPQEQRLFRHLAVFVGGCSLQAIEAISAIADMQGESLLDAVTSLLNQSLLQREPQVGADEQRFTMLETIRDYAVECLQNSGEEEIIREVHAEYYLEQAQSLELRVIEGEPPYWVEWFESEFENLRAAFGWFLASCDAERALSMSGSLWTFWLQSSIAEGQQWVRLALDCCQQSITQVKNETRARTLHVAAMLEYYKGNWKQADILAKEALQLFQALENTQGIARVHTTQAIGALLQGDYAAASLVAEESLHPLQGTQSPWFSAEALLVLSYSTYLRGEHERAYELGKQGFTLSRQTGELYTIIRAIHAVALFANVVGYQDDVQEMCEEGMTITRMIVETGMRSPLAVCLIGMGAVVALQKQYAWAASLWGKAKVLYKRRDGLSELEPYKWLATILRTHLLYAQVMEEVHTQLGEERFARAWDEGQRLSLEQLLTGPECSPPSADSPPPASTTGTLPSGGSLTPREREVLHLLTQGLSSPQIADRLVISLATVNSHVRTIYSKLGVSSRSAATRYALEHRLV